MRHLSDPIDGPTKEYFPCKGVTMREKPDGRVWIYVTGRSIAETIETAKKYTDETISHVGFTSTEVIFFAKAER